MAVSYHSGPLSIVGLIVGQGLIVSGLGLAAGLLASWLLARSMAALLCGVTAQDGVTYLLAAIVVGVVSAAACLGPAWRASRIDPVRALRG